MPKFGSLYMSHHTILYIMMVPLHDTFLIPNKLFSGLGLSRKPGVLIQQHYNFISPFTYTSNIPVFGNDCWAIGFTLSMFTAY